MNIIYKIVYGKKYTAYDIDLLAVVIFNVYICIYVVVVQHRELKNSPMLIDVQCISRRTDRLAIFFSIVRTIPHRL